MRRDTVLRFHDATERSSSPRSARGRLAAWTLLTASLLAACSQQPLSAPVPVPAPAPSASIAAGPRFGTYTYGGVWSGIGPVLEVEDALGRRLDVVHWFMGFDDAYEPDLVNSVLDGGRAPMISWEPTHATVAAIASGAHDAYLRDWARGLRDAGGAVYLRPFPEMNGNWAPWNGDPDTLIAAWRRMAAIFDAEGATNVRWVFSPNVTDEPRTDANRMERYYPGDDVVDVLALDGYNWGDTRDWSTWTSFEDVFRAGYDRIAHIGPQPIWFAEVASAEAGGDKAAWVADMFASAETAFPRLEALVWFDERKEADWRIASRPEVLDAFRAALVHDASPRTLALAASGSLPEN